MTSTEQALYETRETSRQRRALEQKITDLREDFRDQQSLISSLLPQLSDPSADGAEQRLSTERTKLKTLSVEIAYAECELQKFAEHNPAEEELREREKQLALQVDDQQRRAAMEEFAVNLSRRLQLIEELRSLENESINLFSAAKQRWPHARDTTAHAYAGIVENLTCLIPNFFPPPAGTLHVTGSTSYVASKKRAEDWLSRWLLQMAA